MTINVTLNNVSDLTNTVTAQNVINTNSNTITTAFKSALNSTGDTMQGTLDMNSNPIINLPAPVSGQSPVRLVDITTSTTISVALPSMTGVVTASATAGKSVTTFSGSGNLPVSQLNAGSGASASTFWRGDGAWASPSSIAVTAGANITVSGTNPASVSIQTTSTNYTFIQGQGSTGASLLIGNATDPSVYARATNLLFQNSAGTTQASIAAGVLQVGVAGSVDGSLKLARQTGTSVVTISASQTSTAYTLFLPTTLAGAGSLFVSGGTGSATWSGAATTANQMYLSAVTASPVVSTSIWPVDCATNQVLVCKTNSTWSASQTVTNLTLTTPTLTTATMTGTTILVNATMSGNLTFSTGTIGVVGCADTSSGSAGQIGEFISASTSNIPLLNTTASQVGSIVLTPGDWDIYTNCFLNNNASAVTVVQFMANSINSTVAENAVPGAFSQYLIGTSPPYTNRAVINAWWTGPFRVSIAATSTYFNVMNVGISTGSVSGSGLIRARRVR